MNQYLYHHGVKGQRWGIRKYQNEDGTLTEAGKKRYRYDEPTGKISKKGEKRLLRDQLKSKEFKDYSKEQYKRLKKDKNRIVQYNENGYIAAVFDSSGNPITKMDMAAASRYGTKVANRAMIGTALALIGGSTVASIMLKNH